jgi:hypothetical protein
MRLCPNLHPHTNSRFHPSRIEARHGYELIRGGTGGWDEMGVLRGGRCRWSGRRKGEDGEGKTVSAHSGKRILSLARAWRLISEMRTSARVV